MKIIDPVLHPYQIHVDNANFAVEQDTGNDDKYGTRMMINHGFFTSLENAVLKIAKQKLLSSKEECTIKEYIAEFNRIVEELKEALK